MISRSLCRLVGHCAGKWHPGVLWLMVWPVAVNAAAPDSDDFNGCELDPVRWTLIDPLGGGAAYVRGTGTEDAHLVLEVPGGASHNVWTEGNDSVRVMQPASVGDFEVQAKFGSPLTAGYQMHGLLVEQDPGWFMRYDMAFDGSQAFLFYAAFEQGAATTWNQLTVANTSPAWLSVARAGDTWTLRYSANGTIWTTFADFSFPLTVAWIGPFAGNYSPGSAPAYTARVDYFLNTADLFTQEDGPLGTPGVLLTRTVAGQGTIHSNPDADLYYCQETVTLTAVADPGWEFVEWGGDLSGSNPQQILTMSEPRGVVATFTSNSTPAALESDDFNSCTLDMDRWTLIDPLGGGSATTTGTGSDDAWVEIFVPGGPSHDLWVGYNETVRIMEDAPDADFEAVAKFESAPLVGHQMQGLVVEQEAGVFLRYEVMHDGSGVYLFSASIDGSTAHVYSQQPVSGSSPIWLSVTRTADTWDLRYSHDGENFLPHCSFTFPMTVNQVGIWGGNYSTGFAPEFTVLVDYFLNVEDPFDVEDGPIPGATLTTSVTGSGRIEVDPEAVVYYCNEPVTVHAVADPGWEFVGWGGGLQGTQTPRTLVMSQSYAIEATFEPLPVISDIRITPQMESALIEWKTDVPTRSQVDYGTTPEYETGSVLHDTFLTEHAVWLENLLPNTRYHLRIIATSAEEASGVADGLTFLTAADPSGLFSDDFNACSLDTMRWTVVDPVGDGQVRLVGTGSDDAVAEIHVPGGAPHAISMAANNAVRLMQSSDDVDFEVRVKFDSMPSQPYQSQGLLVEENVSRFLRYELMREEDGIHLFAASIFDRQAAIRGHQAVSGEAPLWMSIQRTGDNWVLSYSHDGINWISFTSFPHDMIVRRVGPFAASHSYSYSPAYTARVDYFLNTAAPLLEEDGPLPGGISLVSTVTGQGSILADPDQEVYYCGELVTLTAVAEEGWQFVEWQGDLQGSDPVQTLSMTQSRAVAALFEQGGPTIDVWYGGTQEFGLIGTPQPMVNILGNVSDPNGVQTITYSLNGGPQVPLNLGPDHFRLAHTGDFNVDLYFSSLVPGANELVLKAFDPFGRFSIRTVSVINSQGASWPLPYTADWSTAANVNDIAQVVDGHWVIDGDSVRALDIAYDRLVAIGDLSWQTYEVTVPITVYSIDEGGYSWPSNGPGVGVLCRWPGHSDDGRQPISGVYPLGAIGMYRWTTSYERFEIFGNEGYILASDPSSLTLEFGVTYNFKMRAETLDGGTGRYSLKVWDAADPFEPDNWLLVANQNAVREPGYGSLLLLAHHVDARFGKVEVLPGPFTSESPLAITDIQLLPLSDRAVIEWNTNYDTKATLAYGTTPAYELGAFSDPVYETSRSMEVDNLQPSTEYHARITAVREDGMGIHSQDITFVTVPVDGRPRKGKADREGPFRKPPRRSVR